MESEPPICRSRSSEIARMARSQRGFRRRPPVTDGATRSPPSVRTTRPRPCAWKSCGPNCPSHGGIFANAQRCFQDQKELKRLASCRVGRARTLEWDHDTLKRPDASGERSHEEGTLSQSVSNPVGSRHISHTGQFWARCRSLPLSREVHLCGGVLVPEGAAIRIRSSRLKLPIAAPTGAEPEVFLECRTP